LRVKSMVLSAIRVMVASSNQRACLPVVAVGSADYFYILSKS